MKISTTVEPQYQFHVDLREQYGLVQLGIEKSGAWRVDPRRLLFCLSRYKFVAKMLSGSNRVLELGCGDGWPLPIVLQEVKHVHGVDIDPVFIEDALERLDPTSRCSFAVHDILTGPVAPEFDAVFSLDVLEHIAEHDDEKKFMRNLVASIADRGVAIIGIPSYESQQYASPASKAGHINCKKGPDLKAFLGNYFDHVFIFSMNDEVIHTGFHPMAQYLFALCTGPRR
ncbi:class I SAM-dependent methyltransferase [Shewanella sp.]|jgi:2-polyprenyl-3-methyl-5-hydroxy-6-metoxy-1,4-benzoquinol methylase|uniref:class I SAM-dependent methyltransferase n=1 Tax=Shewanella sp. TaxID=50422 RepID=UPI0040478115